MKKRDTITRDAIEWYKKERQFYLKLCDDVTALLKERLEEENILYNDISYRAKEIDSFKEKCYKTKYSNPISEIYDMAGVRVTTYTTAEVKKIKAIIESTFVVDVEHCSDKSETIEVDRFGYLSVHYIAEFRDDGPWAPNHAYSGMKFEIQVRTLLQHAWSEVEHDRNYKFNGVLPKELKRRFYRLAGILELVDDEFESLAMDVEKYKHDLEGEKDQRELDVLISRQAITAFFSEIYEEDLIFDNTNDEVIDMLAAFKISTLRDLDNLYGSVCEDIVLQMLDLNGPSYNVAQLARDILIVKDVDKYFKQWAQLWAFEQEDIDYFKLFDVDISPYCQD